MSPAALPGPRDANKPAAPEADVKMSFLGHLVELRKRLFLACLGIAVGMTVVAIFSSEVFDWLMVPVRQALPPTVKLVFIDPIEPFLVYFKVAIYGGIFLAVPWILYQLWMFVAPGLYRKERKMVFPFVFWGTTLFYMGGLFCRYVVMPPAFPAILGIARAETATPMLGMAATLTIVVGLLMAFGVAFETPLVITFLAMIGLVTPEFLAKYRRHAIVLNFLIAAIITPTGDPINMSLMAIPMIFFYEVGIIMAKVMRKRRLKEKAARASAALVKV